jgi:PASTA domain/WD40-like Beta Propeller Repeat
VVPAIEGAPTEEYAQKVADEGLIPASTRAFDASEAGTLFATDPPGGTTVKAGTKVTLLVSGGFPQLVFDNDKDILRVHGATGEKLDPVADGPAREKDPAFSPDGTRVAYVGGRRVFLGNLERPDATDVPLTADTDEFADLSWAPTLDVNLLAMGRIKGDDRDLCLGQITRDGMTPKCIDEPAHSIGGTHWAPNGKSILAGGVGKDGTFGIVRWRSKKAFSPDTADWGKGKFVTDTSVPGQGAIDAAISPDGRRLALVARSGNRPFRLVLAKAGDFAMTDAKQTQVRACKVQWRPDGRELVVKQADEFCVEEIGSLVRVPVNDLSKETQVTGAGDNPVFEPLKLDDGG